MAQIGERARAFLAWFRGQSRGMQTGVGCGGLIVACVVCSVCVGLAGAVGNGGSASSANGGSGQRSGEAQATATATARPKPTATPKPKQYVTVQHFSGHDNQQTETFHAGDTWRIVWTAKVNDPSIGAGNFSIELNTSDGQLVDLVANTSSTGGATYNAHTGSGDFYLKIDALFMDYDVQVQTLQ